MFVPINDSEFILDVIRALRMPVVVAARSALGTINHTTLTVRALRRAGASVKGVVMIGQENKDNERSIERYADVAVIGRIPWLDTIDRRTLLDVFRVNFDRKVFV